MAPHFLHFTSARIRMMPYLIITKEQVDEGLKLLEETCKKFGYPKKD